MYRPLPSIGSKTCLWVVGWMCQVDVYLRVRRAVMVDGMSIREVSRVFGLHRDTVRKILAYSVPPGYRRQNPPRRPKLEPFTGVIDQILADDRRPQASQEAAPHSPADLPATQGRAWVRRPVTIVKDYVREHRRRSQEMFVPLSHPPADRANFSPSPRRRKSGNSPAPPTPPAASRPRRNAPQGAITAPGLLHHTNPEAPPRLREKPACGRNPPAGRKRHGSQLPQADGPQRPERRRTAGPHLRRRPGTGWISWPRRRTGSCMKTTTSGHRSGKSPAPPACAGPPRAGPGNAGKAFGKGNRPKGIAGTPGWSPRPTPGWRKSKRIWKIWEYERRAAAA